MSDPFVGLGNVVQAVPLTLFIFSCKEDRFAARRPRLEIVGALRGVVSRQIPRRRHNFVIISIWERLVLAEFENALKGIKQAGEELEPQFAAALRDETKPQLH